MSIDELRDRVRAAREAPEPSLSTNTKKTGSGWKAALFRKASQVDGPSRRALYFVSLERSRQTGRLSLELRYQERLKSGEWGAVKSSRLDNFALGTFDDPKDREIFGLLLSPLNLMRQAAFDVREKSFEVDPLLLSATLPSLVDSERVFLIEADAAQGSPLTLGTEPWEFELDVHEEATGFRVDGRMTRSFEKKREKIPLRSERDLALLAGGFFLRRGSIERVNWGENYELARHLVSHSIPVPATEEVDFVVSLAHATHSPPVRLPPSLRWPFVETKVEGVAKLVPLENVAGAHCRLDLRFRYASVEIETNATQKALLDPEGRRRIKRNSKAERALLSGVRQDLRTDETVKSERIPALIESLHASDWTIELAGRSVARFTGAKGSLKLEGQRLRLDLSFDFEGEAVSLATFFASCAKGERFSRLTGPRFGFVPDSWVDKLDLLSRGSKFGENGSLLFEKASIPLFKPIFDEIQGLDCDSEAHRVFAGIEKLTAPAIEAEKPKALRANLRSYQGEGLAWLEKIAASGFGGILADDMGLGKTIQIISYLLRRATPGRTGPRPSLVVLPKSLTFNWLKEIDKFGPTLRVLDFSGTVRGMLKANDYDVVVTTYHVMKNELDRLEKIEFDTIILDEAQAIKNPGSQIAQAVFQLKGRYRFALSGTPIENSLVDLFSLMKFANPGLMPSGLAVSGSDTRTGGLSKDALKKLSLAVRPFVLRRTKKQVLTELPDKTEQVLYCDLEGEQKRDYEKFRRQYRESMRKIISENGAGSKMQVLEALLRLRQICCHPGLIDPSAVDDSSAKFDVLLEHLEEIRASGNKALVFSQFTSLLALLKPHLEKAGIKYEYLDGQTRDRGAVVDRFNESTDTTVFLISLKAGGTGLNLTTASYVFLLDPWWNPAAEAQAIDRAYRMGQKQKVTAYRLIATGSIEERILRLQAQKRSLAEAVISEGQETLARLSLDDLAALFD